jgi:hypothetical protein
LAARRYANAGRRAKANRRATRKTSLADT